MTAKIIDGNAIAKLVRAEWRARVDDLKSHGVVPGLAVILIGDNAASQVYVHHKTKACADMGMRSELHTFPSDVTEKKVLECIARLNADPKVHGILVQLPLPAHIDVRRLLEAEGHRAIVHGILPNNENEVREHVRALTLRTDIDVILLSGGTGLSGRDCSVEAIRPVLDKEMPGPIPHTIVVAPGGEVVYRHNGLLNREDVANAILDKMNRYWSQKK